MKIFDNMQVNPATLSPTWQGVIGAAMLFGNIVIEADKARCEREAKEPADTPTGHTTLADVMEQSGLKIPQLQDALTAFMGGTDEAKEVAAMIVEMPDPAKLLREFTRQYRGCGAATRAAAAPPPTAANGPIVTPPPATAARSAAEPASPPNAVEAPLAPKLATFRPEFTPEGLAATKAAQAAPGGHPKLATFRPEFTAEGLAAKTTATPGPKLAAVRPDSTPDGLAPGRPAVPVTPASVGGQSLAEAIVVRLEALTQQRAAHEADLDTRMRCAEAELALLHEELIALRGLRERPILFVVRSSEEAAASPAPEPAGSNEPVTSATTEPVVPIQPATVAGNKDLPGDEASAPTTPLAEVNAIDGDGTPNTEVNTPAVEVDAARDEPAVDLATQPTNVSQEAAVTVEADPTAECAQAALPAPSSEADLARAYVIVDKFSDQQQASYARDSERMRSIERMISTLRGQIETERSLRMAGDRG